MTTVHKYSYTCPKADWDGVHEQRPAARLFWSMYSLAGAYLAMEKICPAVTRGEAQMRLHIDQTAYTVEYRPVAARTLLTSCYCCPQDSPHPTEHPNHPPQGAHVTQLPDASDSTQRFEWACQRTGCTMTGRHNAYRWAVEAVMLHNEATDHKALAAAVAQIGEKR